MTLMEILNSPLLYALVGGALVVILGICLFFFMRSRKHALELGVPKAEFDSAMKGCVVFSIVPSIAVIIGLFALAPLLGAPWPWFRLSVVGSVQYELMAADLAAQGVGYENVGAFNTSNDPSALGAVMFVMSIGIMAGMFMNLVGISRKACQVSNSFSAKGGAWGALAVSCFTVAMMCTFLPAQMVSGLIPLLVVIVSSAVTIGLSVLAQKKNIRWLGDYIMAFALIIGMASAVIFTNILG